jgi:hypothetical protein
MYRYFFLGLLITFHGAESLRLPKIFSNGMVLQAAPTDAQVWGFLDGNTATVEMSVSCVLKAGTTMTTTQKYIPKQV